MNNWCPGNPDNKGHEPAHSNPEGAEGKFNAIYITSPSPEHGPSGKMDVCKHCMLLYFTEVESPTGEAEEEKKAEAAE